MEIRFTEAEIVDMDSMLIPQLCGTFRVGDKVNAGVINSKFYLTHEEAFSRIQVPIVNIVYSYKHRETSITIKFIKGFIKLVVQEDIEE